MQLDLSNVLSLCHRLLSNAVVELPFCTAVKTTYLPIRLHVCRDATFASLKVARNFSFRVSCTVLEVLSIRERSPERPLRILRKQIYEVRYDRILAVPPSLSCGNAVVTRYISLFLRSFTEKL